MTSETSSLRNSLKDKLARGEVASSLTVRLVANSEIVLVAQTAGFDSIYMTSSIRAFRSRRRRGYR